LDKINFYPYVQHLLSHLCKFFVRETSIVLCSLCERREGGCKETRSLLSDDDGDDDDDNNNSSVFSYKSK
jgi:hypothetical protein